MSSAVMVTEPKSKTAGFVRTMDKPRFFGAKWIWFRRPTFVSVAAELGGQRGQPMENAPTFLTWDIFKWR